MIVHTPEEKKTKAFAQFMDREFASTTFRDQFHFPKHGKKEAIYFCGNSLGLQPKAAKTLIEEELNDWARFGVEGHFQAKRPWFAYHHFFTESLAKIVGAKPLEVVAMNTLTVNLHLLMLSFYKPNKQRFKIIMEAGAFPSDQYAMETQVKMYGLDPEKAIVELHPREGEHTLRDEDIEASINKHGKQLAMVLMGGVNYYTGQLFNMKKITEWAHHVGAIAGFDLAHAVGNVPLQLHAWQVDFACWCSYKYLNAGPGAVGGIYVNEKHAKNANTFRLAGWWGHDEKTRFKMKKGFKPMKSAESWQMSNAQVFNMTALRASLDIYDQADASSLHQKSVELTAYAAFLLKQITHLSFDIITPSNPKQRGCQLSLLFKKNGKAVFDTLSKAGIIADWREPNVIRIAPVPLYNTFSDVWTLYNTLNKLK